MTYSNDALTRFGGRWTRRRRRTEPRHAFKDNEMSPYLEKQLFERYPQIFSGQERIWCWDGWFNLIDTLCSQLQLATAKGAPQVTTWQVREKLGGLRFHVQRPEPLQHGMIKLAEAMSLGISDLCGNRGKLRGLDGDIGSRWMRTRCDEHANTQPE